MPRYAERIEDIVRNSNMHLTAEQIFMEIKKEYPGIALATIYNNLNTLNESGRIRKISVSGTPDRYDTPQRHDHLVCRICGALADITLKDLTETIEQQVGEEILSYDLKINYICPGCRKKEGFL